MAYLEFLWLIVIGAVVFVPCICAGIYISNAIVVTIYRAIRWGGQAAEDIGDFVDYTKGRILHGMDVLGLLDAQESRRKKELEMTLLNRPIVRKEHDMGFSFV